jgi:hypothetical protein
LCTVAVDGDGVTGGEGLVADEDAPPLGHDRALASVLIGEEEMPCLASAAAVFEAQHHTTASSRLSAGASAIR